jgi:hypothetical protein
MYKISCLHPFVLVDTNLINWENFSTTTKITSLSCHNGTHVINSIKTLSNKLVKIGRFKQPKLFIMHCLGVLTFDAHVNTMLHVFLHVGPIESSIQILLYGFLPMVPHHWCIMHLLHDFHVQLHYGM